MRTTLSTLHHQTIDWLRELEFYTIEISILAGRLDEVMGKNAGNMETAKLIRYYENKFLSLREQSDNLSRDIQAREEKVEKTVIEMPDRIDEQFRLMDDKLFDRMALLAKGIASTRLEFNRFLLKVM